MPLRFQALSRIGLLAWLLAMALSASPAAAQGRRVALVIGNTAYAGQAALPNAVRDAEMVAQGFRAIGFKVTMLRNLDKRSLSSALQAFEDEAEGADVAALYFAGHGIAADGRNWLLPVDARLANARHLEDEAVPHTRLAAAVEGARGLQLVILDACRNSPFSAQLSRQPGTRAVASRGLEPIPERDLPPNRLIAFSARDGQVAQDGPAGGNGPYAAALVRRMAEPGVEVGLLFRRVRDDVATATQRAQEPWVYNNLGGQELYLAGAPRPAVPQTSTAAVPAALPPQVSPEMMDLEFWRSVQSSRSVADFEAYVAQFPQGRFVSLARNRIADLRAPATGASAVPAPAETPQAAATLLARDGIAEAQRLLIGLGFDTGGSDGAVGPRSRWALSTFAWSEGMARDTDFTTATLERIRQVAQSFARLTERGDRSPRGTAATAVADIDERYNRGWTAERATPADANEAAYWYALAARQGDIRAVLQLGLLLARGQGAAADPVGAIMLWRLAAARGDNTASFNLGAMYERGIGVTANPQEARRWYAASVSAGNTQARDALRRVEQ